jgi:hypothetical protein
MPGHIQEAAPHIREAAPHIREAVPHSQEAAPTAYSIRVTVVVVALLRGLGLRPAALAAVHCRPILVDMAT